MVKTLEAVVRKRWLSPEEAVREVVSFENRFGDKHFAFACHCALPLIVTPELVNLIRINFLDDQDIPWIAQSDFLLSSLCRPLQLGVYEVEPCIREVLLVELENNFGWQRAIELAEFLYYYLDKKPNRKLRKNLRQTQEWIAKAYLDPDSTINEIKEVLDTNLKTENLGLDLPTQSQIPHLVEILAEPLEVSVLWNERQYLVNTSRAVAKLLANQTEGLNDVVNDESVLMSPAIKKYLNLEEELIENRKFETVLNNIRLGDNLSTNDIQFVLNNINFDKYEFTDIPHNTPINDMNQFARGANDLSQLIFQLKENNQQGIIAIKGMGGVGKTELAIQYCLIHLLAKSYQGGICWLKVREQNIGLQIIHFAEIYLNLKPPEDWNLVQKVEFCWSRWQEKKLGDVLVVLDDVTDYSEIQPYLPPRLSHFQVLITTRLDLEAIPSLNLDVLNEIDAINLLKRWIQESEIDRQIEQVKELCFRLGYLPLALKLVGKYIQKHKISIKETLTRLEAKGLSHPSLQVNQIKTSDIEKGVVATFELSWQELSQEAQQLGCLLSIFALARVQRVLIEKIEMGFNAEQKEDACIELTTLNLIKENKIGYRLHQLIREFFQDKLEQLSNKNNLKRSYVELMLEISPQMPQIPTLNDINKFEPIILHIIELAENLTQYLKKENQEIVNIFTCLARFYEGQGIYDLAIPWLEQCVQLTSKRLGNEHTDVAISINNLARIYYFQGKYEQSEPLYIQALNIRKKILGENHPDIATSLNNLANLYYSQGKYEQAEPIYLRSLELRKKLLGEQHPDVATSLNNLATLYDSQEKYEQAEPIYLQSLDIRRQIWGNNHPDIATTLNNLANLYYSQKKYEQAKSLYLLSLDMFRTLLGEQHPEVANSLNNLAGLYQSTGKHTEAETLYLQSLKLKRQLLGEQHPSIASSLNNLASLYQSIGKYVKAKALYQQSLEIYRNLLGNEHPSTKTTTQNLISLRKQLMHNTIHFSVHGSGDNVAGNKNISINITKNNLTTKKETSLDLIFNDDEINHIRKIFKNNE